MQVYAAAQAGSDPKAPRPATSPGQSLLLTESPRALGGAPSLFESLSPRERETVLKHGRRKVLYRGQTLFNQGAKHDGIYLIETGRLVMEGPASRLRDDENIRKAYLGY